MAFCKNIEIVNIHQKSNTLLTYKISNSQETRKKEWKISFTSIKLRQMLFLLVEGIKKNLLKRSFATEHAFISKNKLAFFL